MLLFFILTLFCSSLFSVSVNAETIALAKNCKAAYLCDAMSGEVVYARNETAHMPIASMCKIMTLLLCFEAEESGKISFDDTICVSDRAAGMGGSQVFLEAGGNYFVKDLIESICIASANDSCVAMAETICGSEEIFVKKMNERAEQLGMKDTSFSDCTGLPKEGQYSCARDVSVMLRELLKKQAYYSFSKIWMDEMLHSGGRVTQMANTNKLIRNYQGCDAGKTGYTAEAGFCLAASAMRGGMRVVSVVMGAADSKTRFDGVSEMFDFAFANYTSKCVLEEKVLQEIKCEVSGGKQREVSVIPERACYVFGNKGEEDKIELEYNVTAIKAPVSVGVKVGEVIVYKNGVECDRVVLLANEAVSKRGYFDGIREIAENWVLQTVFVTLQSTMSDVIQ